MSAPLLIQDLLDKSYNGLQKEINKRKTTQKKGPNWPLQKFTYRETSNLLPNVFPLLLKEPLRRRIRDPFIWKYHQT
jgi:hypothetical protein